MKNRWRSRTMLTTNTAMLAAAVVFASLTGCFGEAGRARPAQGSAIWLEPGHGELTADEMAKLAAAGVEQVVAAFWRLEGSGASLRLVADGAPVLPRRTKLTIAVRGSWRAGGAAAAAALASELERLRLELDSGGLVTTGILLDVAAGKNLADYAAMLEALRETLDPGLPVAVAVAPEWLDDEAMAEVASHVDSFVVWAYGQRPAELEGRGFVPERWDLRQIDLALGKLEELGRPYHVGVVTLNTALRVKSSGKVAAITHGGELEDLALSRAFELEATFVLSGLDCRHYDFKARGNARFADWQLAAGESIEIVGLTPSILREYRRRISAQDLPGYLGDLLYRRPGEEESYSPTYEGLVSGLGPNAEEPLLELSVPSSRGTGHGLAIKVALTNPNLEATEVAFIDSNYLEIAVSRGWIHRVDLGDFQRYQLLRRQPDGSLEPTLRQPDVLRLFRPILGRGQTVTSGELVIQGASAANVSLGALYVLASGRSIAIENQPMVQ